MTSKIKDEICKRGKTWSVVIRETDPATGNTKPLWKGGFKTEQEAKSYRDDRRASINRGQANARDEISVKEYLDLWLPSHIATKGLKPSTAHGYRTYIDRYVVPRIGGLRLQHVRPMTTSMLYTELPKSGARGGGPLSPATVQQVGTILKQALKH